MAASPPVRSTAPRTATWWLVAFGLALTSLLGPIRVEAQSEPLEPEPAPNTGAAAPETAALPPSADAPAPSEAEAAVPAQPPAPVQPLGTLCQGRTIARIDVAGQGRVAAEDIRATIKLRVGLPCTDGEVTRDANALWDMGYFADIRVEGTLVGEKIALTYVVKERPAIASITFAGNDELDETDLTEKVTLREGSILSIPAVREQLGRIRDYYAEEGFFLAQVKYELEARPNNAVNVKFVIDEGDKVTVRRIRFLGNEALDDDELKGVMQTGETNLFSFLKSNNTYRKDMFEQDVSLVQALYYDHGYLTVEIADPRVELTPDRRHIDITIPITEGPRFRVKRVKAEELDDDGSEVAPLPGRKELREMVHLNPGDWFSRAVIAEDLQTITRYYRDRGYAKVEVIPNTQLDVENHTVDLIVQTRRGPLVYIQRINIKGNTKTRDAVLRREARIVEGQLYSQTLVERSRERMEALGYFETVTVSEEDGAAYDKLILNFEIAEKPTGTFQVGAGFSSQETFLLTAQVQQQNLFGRGQSLALNLQLSGIRQLAQVRFVEPYLFGSRWTMSTEVFKMLRQQRSFDRDSTGGSLSFGHPLSFIHDNLFLFANYRLEYVNISPATGGLFGTGSGQDFLRFQFLPLRNLFSDGFTSSIRLTLSWDSRNNRLFPTKGLLVTGSSELADSYLGSDNNFWRHSANLRFYQPLIWKLVGKLNVEWGLITSRSGIGVPIYERYFLGGITDVRGFPIQSVGPRLSQATSYGDPAFLLVPDLGVVFGGNMQFYYNLEIEFPIVEMIGIKGVIFTDGGNAWNTENVLCEPAPVAYDRATDPCSTNPFILRTSWGFGVRWFSPLGPLRFEWGLPFNPRYYEDSIAFQFTVGNAF